MKKIKPNEKGFTYGDGTPVPKDVIKKFLDKDGKMKIDKVYKNTPFYEDLKNVLNEYVELSENLMLKVKSFDIVHAFDYEIYQNECTEIEVPFGFLRFGSRGDDIDISRVDVDEDYQGRGIGSHIMSILMSTISLVKEKYRIEGKKIPDIVLECAGTVGVGKNQKFMPIQKQVKFFSKFGFVPYKVIPNQYVHMKLNHDLFSEYINRKIEEAGIRELD